MNAPLRNMLPVPVDMTMLGAEAASIVDLSPQLLDAYNKVQIWRTKTEIWVSNLNEVKHPTRASKYWQAVREQVAMLQNLVGDSFAWRRNELRIEELKLALERTSGFKQRRIQIDLDECFYKRADIERAVKDRCRELRDWEDAKVILDDGSFDTQDVDSHQLVSYAKEFVIRAAIADTSQMNAGERDNLEGLVRSTLRRCSEHGVLDQVRKGLPERAVKALDKIVKHQLPALD